jgi:hypothetical protein
MHHSLRRILNVSDEVLKVASECKVAVSGWNRGLAKVLRIVLRITFFFEMKIRLFWVNDLSYV